MEGIEVRAHKVGCYQQRPSLKSIAHTLCSTENRARHTYAAVSRRFSQRDNGQAQGQGSQARTTRPQVLSH